jgi:hypothetical protein
MTTVFTIGLILACAAAPIAVHAAQAQEPPPATAQEIQSLVAELATRGMSRDRAFSISARLQNLGPAAVTAVVARLRHDTVRYRHHGAHSAVQEALERIGTPASNPLITVPLAIAIPMTSRSKSSSIV